MIRINLLPEAKRSAGGGAGSQAWGTLYLVAALVWCGALAINYINETSQLNQHEAENNELDAQIKRVKGGSGNLDEIQAKLDRSKQLENVVTELLDARQGPARVLMELSQILSPNAGPTVDPKRLEALRRNNPQAGFTPGWDTRRLWITEFSEKQRSCAIAGVGKNNEDVAEFLRRLSLSELFDGVTLHKTAAESVKGAGPSGALMIAFDLTCSVKY